MPPYQPLDVEAEQALGFVSGRRAVFEVAPPEVVDKLIDAASAAAPPPWKASSAVLATLAPVPAS